MTRQRIEQLFQLLQADHTHWEPNELLADVWDRAVGMLSWPTLESAARKYLANETGKPQLSRFVKFLPPGASLRARGMEQEGGGADPVRSREEVFDLVIRECLFDGVSLWYAYESQATRADRYQAWRKLGSDGLRPPDHWNQQHHAPGMLLAFLDRFVGVGGPQGPSVVVEALPF